MDNDNDTGAACSECESKNEVLVSLVDALMKMGVDFEIHQTAA
ncbi:Uncharacterised protein [Mycobacteroides abscessus subsp. massiliense]|nr:MULTISPECIES: hypothetical protein [Mycobacteroides]SHX53798.1 Uncharacterised protein [Mycobacteroides abscessus subsp. abscessus]SKM75760.1 Uncharacterised protein [Mycobacteroides abscessus subsp. massiliense]SKM77042.1 Uncharacterised protein [Mycobacteroides abscessus subsp. massiliense]SKM87560.1 Uncharacterised protein [Mycobacteroides abscessus subsp. massiliense]SKN87622.1 Uncharacterised protein [Mycobacteroides abscessus subsp. massiliense]